MVAAPLSCITLPQHGSLVGGVAHRLFIDMPISFEWMLMVALCESSLEGNVTSHGTRGVLLAAIVALLSLV